MSSSDEEFYYCSDLGNLQSSTDDSMHSIKTSISGKSSVSSKSSLNTSNIRMSIDEASNNNHGTVNPARKIKSASSKNKLSNAMKEFSLNKSNNSLTSNNSPIKEETGEDQSNGTNHRTGVIRKFKGSNCSLPEMNIQDDKVGKAAHPKLKDLTSHPHLQYIDVNNNEEAKHMIKDLVDLFANQNSSLPESVRDKLSSQMCIQMTEVLNSILNDCAHTIYHKVNDLLKDKYKTKNTMKTKTTVCQTYITGDVISKKIFHQA